MTSTTNEAYRLDVNVQEGGAPESDVLVYGFNLQDTVVINKTTDVNGDVTTTNVEVKQFDDDGVSPSTTIRTPIRLRALKFGLFFREQELVPTARLAATFFLSSNTVLTESSQPTIDAYTGITYNDVADLITLNNTGITPVNSVERLYDFTHSRQSKAANVQPDFLEVIGSVDKQNYVYDYDIVINGAFEFDGQNRSFLRGAGTTAQLETAAGGRWKDITCDFMELGSTGAAGLTYNNCNVNNTLVFTQNGTYTWNGGTLNNVDLGGAATAVTLELLNGATVGGTVDPGITIINAQPISVAGVTEGTPVVVLADETVGPATKGDVLLEEFANSSGQVSGSAAYDPAYNPDGLSVVVRARNQGVAIAALAEDGGVFTNETAEASSNAGSDMTLLPATPAVNDAYYFAHNEQFTRLKLDVSQAWVRSGYTIVWEYWNGTGWSSLLTTDGAAVFDSTGENLVSWTLPGNWATTTVFGVGPLYYVRVRVTVAGTNTTAPTGRRVQLDVTRYLPYVGERKFTSTGLADTASWQPDTIAKFLPTD